MNGGNELPNNAEELSLLFAYGTLMSPKPGSRWARILSPVTPAMAQGIMYNINRGSYPGVLDGFHTVYGQLLQIKAAAKHQGLVGSLRELDDYEGYEPHMPHGSLYLRKKVRVVRLDTGALVDAWMYFFNHSVDGYAMIPSGRWKDRT